MRAHDTEFSNSEYDEPKKVYSIWVCMNTSEQVSDTITSYHLTPYSLYGNYAGETSRYDLLEVIMIYPLKQRNRFYRLILV